MSCFSPDYFQILGWIISTNIHWIFFLQSWQFLLRIQLRQPRRQRCRSVGGILAPPSTTWPSCPPTSTPSSSCSPSSRTPSSPSPPPPRGPWLPPHQTISSIPKCEKRIEADRRKIGQTKELLNAFSLSEITISRKKVIETFEEHRTQIKHMSRKCEGKARKLLLPSYQSWKGQR